jgi:hypothetical protein
MKWQPNLKNPIIKGDELFGDGYRTEDSKIAKYGDKYYMLTSSGKNGDVMDIYLLESLSLEGPWVKVQNDPIVVRGKFYEFDYKYLRLGSISFDQGVWYLYYSGQNLLRQDAVGVAITSEKDFPFGWKKYKKNPILKRSGNGFESSSILTLCLKKIGPADNEWYGHYTGKGKDRKYHLGICSGKSPVGPFTRFEGNPILGQGDWDFNGPARADFIKIDNKILGSYESAKSGPVFQIGGYESDDLDGPFKKTFADRPLLSGLPEGLQYANPCLWQEDGKVYLLVARKESTEQTPWWHYVDLFTLEKE